MPPAKDRGYFHTERRLDVNAIAYIEAIKNGKAEIIFEEQQEYLGVLFVSIALSTQENDSAKRQKFECRAIVIGQNQTETGQIAFFKCTTTTRHTLFGPGMKQTASLKVETLHWWSGSQIKYVPSITQEPRVKIGMYKQKVLQDARLELVKSLLTLLEKADSSDSRTVVGNHSSAARPAINN
jgi:hypothetical protein